MHIVSKGVALACALVSLSACGHAPAQAARGGRPAAVQRAPPRGPAVGPREAATAVDLDGDGTPDLWRIDAARPDGTRHLVRVERDLNADGRVDRWDRLADDGSVAEIDRDMDLDGRPDVAFQYRGGVLVRRDDAFGGLPRTATTYPAPDTVRKERDLDRDGKPDATDLLTFPEPAHGGDWSR